VSETIVLDPNEETPDRFEVDITPYIGVAGPDFGEAVIEAFFADADLGQVPIAHTIPNRVVTIPLNVHGRTGLTFDELRSRLQSKVGLWQREGGVIKRQTSIGSVYADIVDARLKFGGSTAQAMQDVDVDAVLTLECIPDWYGTELDLGTETGAGEVICVLTPDRGDHPGRVRVVVTEGEGQPHLGLLWGIRSRHYSADATAALSYEAEDLTPLDAAAVATVTGASGGASNNVVRHAALPSVWTAVLATDLDGVGPLTHTGSYRVWARCHTTSATPPKLRLVWSVGNLLDPIQNVAAAIPGTSNFYALDLGEIRLAAAPFGAHQWRGQVHAIGAAGGENISIDKLWLLPLDELAGSLRARAPNLSVVDYLRGSVDAYDGFDQSSGNLSTQALPSGQAWGAGSGSSATDFQVGSSKITRTIASESAWAGRYALAGSVLYKDVTVEAFITPPAASTPLLVGVLARYSDVNNWLIGGFDVQTNTLKVVKRVAGTITTIATQTIAYPTSGATLTLTALASGDYALKCTPIGLDATTLTGRDANLAGNGALYLGNAGVYSEKRSSGSVAVSLDNFRLWSPQSDAVVHAGRSVELRTDGIYRENSGGAGTGPVTWIEGDFPRLPPSGLEAREVELFVKLSRGDLDQIPDTSPDDDLSVQVLHRPSYLYVPDGGPGS
jgi:hypothetical protein